MALSGAPDCGPGPNTQLASPASDTEMTTGVHDALPGSANAPVPAPVPVSGHAANSTGDATENNAQRIIKRRAPVACRRCRRMRSKCVHENAKPPCKGCLQAGISAEECMFVARGTPDLDREYRHPRMKGEKARKENSQGHSSLSANSGPVGILGPYGPLNALGAGQVPLPVDPWDLLPPLDQVIEGVEMFTRRYFQLGFIPRQVFAEQLRSHTRAASPFMLLGILSVSARMTPSLVAAHGGPSKAAELYMGHASNMALHELYQEPPTLARCQAFYLLSLAQQGSAYRSRSFVNLGIALRMAILLRLHREDTYTQALANVQPATQQNGQDEAGGKGDARAGPVTPPQVRQPPPSQREIVQRAESARRTLWMLYSQDNLHAAPGAPVSLAASDISLLLPCDEDDFHRGVIPEKRAALEDTPPANQDPPLVSIPSRSLFATLMQSHQLWGRVLRGAVGQDQNGKDGKHTEPRDPGSEYATIAAKLRDWEEKLPDNHRWSKELFDRHKLQNLDLAYMAVTMVTRLCNIVIRRAYLTRMLANSGSQQDRVFFAGMATELFQNVIDLYAQIDYWDVARSPDDGTGAQLAIFCVYLCSLMAAYLYKYPTPTTTSLEAKTMLDRTLGILKQSTSVWPLAQGWIESVETVRDAPQSNMLANLALGSHEAGMAEGRDPIPSALHPPPTYAAPMGPSSTPFDNRRQRARPFLPDTPHGQSVSPIAGGDSPFGKEIGMATQGNHMHRLLPPPLRSPNIAAVSAAHYSVPGPLPLLGPAPALSSGLGISGGVPGPLSQPPMQSQVSPVGVLGHSGAGVPSSGTPLSLSGVAMAPTTGISPPLHMAPGALNGMASGMYQQHHQPGTPALTEFPPLSLPAMGQAAPGPGPFYPGNGVMTDFVDLNVLPDDGFRNNLQEFAHGPVVQDTPPWNIPF